MKKAILTLMISALLGCGKVSDSQSHNLSPSSIDKAHLAACTEAKQKVTAAIGTDSSVDSVGILNVQSNCTVSISMNAQEKTLDVLKKVKTLSNSYAYYRASNNINVNVWLLQPVATHPPGHDKAGKVVSPQITFAQCSKAQQQAAQAQPHAKSTIVSIAPTQQLNFPCYVDVAFSDDTSFEAFFNWVNPYSLTHDLFHMDFQLDNGGVNTVWLHVFRSAK